MAPKPPDGTFIIDSDLSPSLPTSDYVLVCAHSALEGKPFGHTHGERESVKVEKGWRP